MKGQVLTFSTMMVGFLALVGVVLIYLMYVAKVQDVHVIVRSADTNIQLMNLAQVLLSSEKLVYVDEQRVYRAVLDKDKLDSVFSKDNIGKELDIYYPNMIAVVGVIDLENTDNKWSSYLVPPKIGATTDQNLITCLKDTLNIDKSMIFRIQNFVYPPVSALLSLWESYDLVKCFTESNIIEMVKNAIIPPTRAFPASIRISDNEIHAASLVVSTYSIKDYLTSVP